jgi:hypothetical protein
LKLFSRLLCVFLIPVKKFADDDEGKKLIRIILERGRKWGNSTILSRRFN